MRCYFNLKEPNGHSLVGTGNDVEAFRLYSS